MERQVLQHVAQLGDVTLGWQKVLEATIVGERVRSVVETARRHREADVLRQVLPPRDEGLTDRRVLVGEIVLVDLVRDVDLDVEAVDVGRVEVVDRVRTVVILRVDGCPDDLEVFQLEAVDALELDELHHRVQHLVRRTRKLVEEDRVDLIILDELGPDQVKVGRAVLVHHLRDTDEVDPRIESGRREVLPAETSSLEDTLDHLGLADAVSS